VGSSPAGRTFDSHIFNSRTSDSPTFDSSTREVLDQLTRALSAVAPRGEFSVIPLYNPRRGADAQIFFARGSAGAGEEAELGNRPGGRDWSRSARAAQSAGPARKSASATPSAGTARESARAARLDAAREALAALPEVAAVSTRRDSLSVRFADARVGWLGERLESGELGVLDARDILGGEEVVVNFCDANPTKALHVGHLRNIALGQALAAALAAAGARVTRQSQVSDYCRSMGEALAGYMELPAHVTPRTLGVKGDHFVGECFMRYAGTPANAPAREDGMGASEHGRPWGDGTQAPMPGELGTIAPLQSEGSGDPALSAEEAVRNDLADELLERWSAGEEEIVERWRRLRGWALEGQDTTLAALGVRLDRMVQESDSRPLTRWIIDTGLACGALTRVEGGAVVYETGEEEYPRLLLARADGFPTQHLRTFALWHALRGSLEGTRSIELVGEEWHAYVRYHRRLMGRIESWGEARQELDTQLENAHPNAPQGHPTSTPQGHPTSNVIYGMVTVEGGPVKSSNGRPPLVDGLLERLSASAELGELAEQSGGRLTRGDLAGTIALGLYLGRPTRKPVDLTLSEMLELRGGIGWELARAAAHAWSPRYDGRPDPAPEDPRYRQTVLQSQFHRQLLGRAVGQLDVYELARFYGHLSRRYLATPADGRVARAMRTLLAAGLGALGLPGAQAAEGGAGMTPSGLDTPVLPGARLAGGGER
jgi:hypothetical protein